MYRTALFIGIICILYLLLHALWKGFFHTNNFSIHDPCFNTTLEAVSLGEIFLCNACFMAMTAALTAAFYYGCRLSADIVLWGIFVGAFCAVWPNIATYRLFNFRGKPEALVTFFICLTEIVYAVGCADFAVNLHWFDGAVLLIPIVGSLLRRRLLTQDHDFSDTALLETKLFVVWKKIKISEPYLRKKYHSAIRHACEEYKIPELFLLRFLMFPYICHGAWNYKLERWIIWHCIPIASVRNRLSLGPCMIKPPTAAFYYGEIPSDIYKRLNDASESIHVLACYLRRIIDQYPGEGRYIPPQQANGVCGTLEYDVLSPAAQLCRYIVCTYMAALPASRMEFADIGMYVLLKSGIEELLPHTDVSKNTPEDETRSTVWGY